MLLHDFILNRQGHGPVGRVLQETRFEPGALRPYWDSETGMPCVTVNLGNGPEEMTLERFRRETGISLPVHNATSLRKQDYVEIDRAVLMETRKRLRAWTDLAAASTYTLNGMSRSILEYETMNDPGEAVVDMDALTDGRADTPLFQLEGLPLPITHSDFWFSERNLAMSRNSTGLDTIMAEAAARRVAETIEKTVIGVETGLAFGGTGRYDAGQAYSRTSQVYGYRNFPGRNTMTGLTVPTGANPQETVDDVLQMRDTLYGDNMFGPFMLYHSTDWDRYLDNDYAFTNSTGWAATPTQTLRQRLRQIEGIADVRRLDFMTPAAMSSTFNLIMVQMTSDVARAVVGMNISTVQWDTQGGLKKMWKVMAIHVPQLRATYAGNCGILQATP